LKNQIQFSEYILDCLLIPSNGELSWLERPDERATVDNNLRDEESGLFQFMNGFKVTTNI